MLHCHQERVCSKSLAHPRGAWFFLPIPRVAAALQRCSVRYPLGEHLIIAVFVQGADPGIATVSSGGWNSIHVVEARVSEGDNKCWYKLTTTGASIRVSTMVVPCAPS